jgi:hypothetical protein
MLRGQKRNELKETDSFSGRFKMLFVIPIGKFYKYTRQAGGAWPVPQVWPSPQLPIRSASMPVTFLKEYDCMSFENVSIWMVTALTIFLTSCGGVAMKSGPEPFSRNGEPNRLSPVDTAGTRAQMPERIYEKEGWKLVVYITNKGTRSQGIHGDLYHNTQKVAGKRGETLTTPLGEIYYHGSEMERAHLWDTTGWTITGKSGFFNLPTPPSEFDKETETPQPIEYGIG